MSNSPAKTPWVHGHSLRVTRSRSAPGIRGLQSQLVGMRQRSRGAYCPGVIVFRPSARALITDPDGRILLLRVLDAVALNASDPVTDYWITVGGGVEPGETFETALVREIFEETQDERTYIQESRWWTLDNPDLRRIRVFPEDFVDAASSVLRNGRPAAAQWLR